MPSLASGPAGTPALEYFESGSPQGRFEKEAVADARTLVTDAVATLVDEQETSTLPADTLVQAVRARMESACEGKSSCPIRPVINDYTASLVLVVEQKQREGWSTKRIAGLVFDTLVKAAEVATALAA